MSRDTRSQMCKTCSENGRDGLVTEAMVERVAKALCVKADCTPGFWRSFVPEAETALDAALTEGANR